jgi:Fe2+ transport system protein B
MRVSDRNRSRLLDFTQSIIAVVITTMFIPCIANIVAMFKEIGVKGGIAMTLSINVSSCKSRQKHNIITIRRQRYGIGPC